jgi:hypothetical protein
MTNTRFDFEWAIGGPDEKGNFHVRERLVGTDLINTYLVPTYATAEAVVKARRVFIHRTITTRTQALQIFQPQGTIIP